MTPIAQLASVSLSPTKEITIALTPGFTPGDNPDWVQTGEIVSSDWDLSAHTTPLSEGTYRCEDYCHKTIRWADFVLNTPIAVRHADAELTFERLLFTGVCACGADEGARASWTLAPAAE